MSDLVWYAAYGSNLLAARFLTYLTGGTPPHRTNEQPHQGARQSTLPLDDRPWPIPHRLFFAASTPNWGGGALAMLDTGATTDHPTLGRIWLITGEQFEDLFRQENGHQVPASPQPGDGSPGDSPDRLFSIDQLDVGGHLDVLDTWYGRVVHLGPGPGGHPVLTFVGAEPDRHQPGPAHESYLRTVGLGLMESWQLDLETAVDYLIGRDGNAGAVARETVTADLAKWSSPS